ncbi:hypothetical protein CK203_039566 [Vitis vinifera]|uniref:Retrotransposon gag domain-containing protein n=1 Tax=Vitis vinifera TaxID=29760 RepID=A0A438HKE7_VITVI|nr:hypothetical protein CK203_039566 [Vitis vinifera]
MASEQTYKTDPTTCGKGRKKKSRDAIANMERFTNMAKDIFTIDIWAAFKREIKRQFYPKDVAYLARKSIKHLKHTSLICEVKATCQDLATTMTIEQPMVEYKKRDSFKPKPPSKGNLTRGKNNNKRKEFTPRTNYFLCNGPHWARECPKWKALNSMIKEKESKRNAHVRTMQLPNDLKTKPVPKTPQNKGLMYMEAHVNSKPTKAMVETGATHNFVSMEEAPRD